MSSVKASFLAVSCVCLLVVLSACQLNEYASDMRIEMCIISIECASLRFVSFSLRQNIINWKFYLFFGLFYVDLFYIWMNRFCLLQLFGVSFTRGTDALELLHPIFVSVRDVLIPHQFRYRRYQDNIAIFLLKIIILWSFGYSRDLTIRGQSKSFAHQL